MMCSVGEGDVSEAKGPIAPSVSPLIPSTLSTKEGKAAVEAAMAGDQSSKTEVKEGQGAIGRSAIAIPIGSVPKISPTTAMLLRQEQADAKRRAVEARKRKAVEIREAKKREAREKKKLELAKLRAAKRKAEEDKKREAAEFRELRKQQALEYRESLMKGDKNTFVDPQTKRIGKEFPAKQAGNVLLQLHVSLVLGNNERRHPWRRIIVPGTLNFQDLHLILQTAFGWGDCHAYLFRIGCDQYFRRNGVHFQVTVISGNSGGQREKRVYEYLWKERDVAWYLYDFGEDWGHQIVLEKVLDRKEGETFQNYPQVTEGKLRAPPEDPSFDETTESGYPDYDEKDFNISQISFQGIPFSFNR